MDSDIPNDWEKSIQQASTLEQLEELKVMLLGKKGVITQQLQALGKFSPEERRYQGEKINLLKQKIIEALEDKKKVLKKEFLQNRMVQEKQDMSLPAPALPTGYLHPIIQAIEELASFLGTLGFRWAQGPDIEEEFYNFTALNIPPDHPARTSHDTFYFPSGKLLRTHTSTVEIRGMEHYRPPVRMMAVGRVYRRDHDSTHVPMFHQIEGLVLEENLNCGHLKWCLQTILEHFFAPKPVTLRFRPSFFPFTEPSFEVDLLWEESGKKQWLEVLGSGMTHPKVLGYMNVKDSTRGFAFGLGIERLVMLRQGVRDVRRYYEHDIHWMKRYGISLMHEGAGR